MIEALFGQDGKAIAFEITKLVISAFAGIQGF